MCLYFIAFNTSTPVVLINAKGNVFSSSREGVIVNIVWVQGT